MAQFEPFLSEEQKKTILDQKLFFVGTAAKNGTVNLSPRGHDSFRILNERQVAWIDYPGSGNETALHLREMDRITLLFCDLEGSRASVRIFGKGRIVFPSSEEFPFLLKAMGLVPEPIIRQLFFVEILCTSNSCGSGVPVYKLMEEGTLKKKWNKIYESGKMPEILENFETLPRPIDVINNPDFFDAD